MSDVQATSQSQGRMLFSLVGALAGIAAYVLVEVLPDWTINVRTVMVISVALGGFFVALLGAMGPLPLWQAAGTAFVAAIPVTFLLWWASLRFEDVEEFLETFHPVAASAVVLSLSLPFLIAAQSALGARHYPTLFIEAWNIVVRYIAAWVFTGIFWGVLALSNALLGLVGVTIIEILLDVPFVPFILTGAVLGLALSVVVELSDYVSPFLVLRLLRLLLPMVLVVSMVFLIALQFQGLSDLFGGFSSAATLMAMVLGIATLITSALDRDDLSAIALPWMKAAAQLSALAMPVMGVLAIYAIWLRVADHGWTPDRLAAATAAALAMGYGVLYGLAVVSRTNWMERIRQANIVMALVIIGVAALWLTPALDPQRITANSQLARFERGDVTVEEFDIWYVGRRLGRAGESVIAELETRDIAELTARIEEMRSAKSRHEFRNQVEATGREDNLAKIVTAMNGAMEDAGLVAGDFADFDDSLIADIAAGCGTETPAGNPGCALARGDYLPDVEGQEAILFYLSSISRVQFGVMAPGAEPSGWSDLGFLQGGRGVKSKPELLDQIIEGDFEIGPTKTISLRVGNLEVFIRQ